MNLPIAELEKSRLELVEAEASTTSAPQVEKVVEATDSAGLLAAEMMRAAEQQVGRLQVPAATYRLQLHHGFRFADATALVPYLHRLGVTHCYASPYLKAVKGSEHGYDLVDHGHLNPEVGSEQDFEQFVVTLRQHSMGHILDFVPNHMGVASNDNLWWQDILENGPSSQYAGYFDIDWSPLKSDLNHKVLLPVLGDQFGRVLENQQLKLEFADGAFTLNYYERQFPVAPRTYAMVLSHRLDELTALLGAENPEALEYQSILTSLHYLPPRDTTDPAQRAERDREKEIVKRRLRTLCEQSPQVLEFVQQNVQQYNGVPGDPRSFDLLEQLLEQQAYRLSHWRVASDEINYRRFFDVNGLAAVCMEQPEVFAKAHAFIGKLIADGHLDGLRIDHADGLYDPAGYLRGLQVERWLQFCHTEYQRITPNLAEETRLPWESFVPRLRADATNKYQTPNSTEAPKSLYVVVEKILEPKEKLPLDWPVAGTSGYDFLADVNSLFVDTQHEKAFSAIYEKFIGEKVSFEEMVYRCKRLIMRVSMSSESHALGHQLDRISEC
jgi:(1->4)-alpha-D-glucan 1-alpha-D-glucosylmutase